MIFQGKCVNTDPSTSTLLPLIYDVTAHTIRTQSDHSVSYSSSIKHRKLEKTRKIFVFVSTLALSTSFILVWCFKITYFIISFLFRQTVWGEACCWWILFFLHLKISLSTLNLGRICLLVVLVNFLIPVSIIWQHNSRGEVFIWLMASGWF